jgi:hypothetical protein
MEDETMTTRTLERSSAPPNSLQQDALLKARAALANSSIYVLRKLQIDRDEDDALVMRGRVDSYYHKQLAQELVKAATDGTKVINALQVVYTPKNDYA